MDVVDNSSLEALKNIVPRVRHTISKVNRTLTMYKEARMALDKFLLLQSVLNKTKLLFYVVPLWNHDFIELGGPTANRQRAN